MIYPVPGEHDWTKTTGPDIEPPKFHVKKGRKRDKRIKGRFEVPKPKESSRMATITCSNCGLQGHRYTSCSKQLKPELALRKNKHVVSTLLTSTMFCIYCMFPSLHVSFIFARHLEDQGMLMKHRLHHKEHMLHHKEYMLHQQEHRLHQQEHILMQGMVLQGIQGLSLHQELLLGLPLLLALQLILDGCPI